MTGKELGEQQASPSLELLTSAGNGIDTIRCTYPGGFTKREALAMAAMQGIVSAYRQPAEAAGYRNNIAEDSVMLADALLEELAKG